MSLLAEDAAASPEAGNVQVRRFGRKHFRGPRTTSPHRMVIRTSYCGLAGFYGVRVAQNLSLGEQGPKSGIPERLCYGSAVMMGLHP